MSAAEVNAGAGVDSAPPDPIKTHVRVDITHLLTPAEARSWAADLLQVADEIEAQGAST